MMRVIKRKVCVSIATLLLALASASTGRTIYVDDDGPADFSNIQAAINDSNDDDIIEVRPGTYTGTGNRDIDFKGKAITVKSKYGPEIKDAAAVILHDSEPF
jgi:pectin methylesterase-like acyl-CoA thioesterase